VKHGSYTSTHIFQDRHAKQMHYIYIYIYKLFSGETKDTEPVNVIVVPNKIFFLMFEFQPLFEGNIFREFGI